MLVSGLHELRNKLGLSRVAFAKDLGSSATQMKRMEIGTVIPDDEFIQKICSTYHVNPAYFTGEIDIDEAVTVVSPEEKKKQIGNRVKQMRIEKGLTLKELSALVGLSYSQLSLIENGEYMLTEKRAADIGEALEVGVEWLLYGDEEKKYFPLNEQMAQWLWKHPEIREQIWKMMDEEKVYEQENS